MNEKEEMKALYTKINALRADILTKDWSDDKNFTMNGKIMYPYLSADKVKKTISPLFHKHGLELVMNFTDLTERGEVGGFKQHWSIKLEATIIDIDTGAEITNSVYGEAGDVGDKGINKAQTAAIKQWVMSQFLVADGIDPESDTPMVKSTYNPKTREENEEIKSQVLSHTVEADKTVKETPAEKPAAAPVEAIAPPQLKAMERIINNLFTKVQLGEFESAEYDKIKAERDVITSGTEAVAFIKKYRGL